MNQGDFFYKPEEEDFPPAPLLNYEVLSLPTDRDIESVVELFNISHMSIPDFQRSFVWSIEDSSKFIESFIMGLPVPQVFLFEFDENKFYIVDGLQRLLSMLFFIKGRFPKEETRKDLGQTLSECNFNINPNDNKYIEFRLTGKNLHKDLKGKTFEELSKDIKISKLLKIRTLKMIYLYQLKPKQDQSVIYEVFTRFNSGGMTLKPQEVRMVIYDSPFYKMIRKFTAQDRFKKFLNNPKINRMEEFEVVLRLFALALRFDNNYIPNLNDFLNNFSHFAKKISVDTINIYEKVLNSFLDMLINERMNSLFINGKKIDHLLMESVFYVSCKNALLNNQKSILNISYNSIEKLMDDKEYKETLSQGGTRSHDRVKKRLARAELILHHE